MKRAGKDTPTLANVDTFRLPQTKGQGPRKRSAISLPEGSVVPRVPLAKDTVLGRQSAVLGKGTVLGKDTVLGTQPAETGSLPDQATASHDAQPELHAFRRPIIGYAAVGRDDAAIESRIIVHGRTHQRDRPPHWHRRVRPCDRLHLDGHAPNFDLPTVRGQSPNSAGAAHVTDGLPSFRLQTPSTVRRFVPPPTAKGTGGEGTAPSGRATFTPPPRLKFQSDGASATRGRGGDLASAGFGRASDPDPVPDRCRVPGPDRGRPPVTDGAVDPERSQSRQRRARARGPRRASLISFPYRHGRFWGFAS